MGRQGLSARLRRLEESRRGRVDLDAETAAYGVMLWSEDDRRCYARQEGADYTLTITGAAHVLRYVVAGVNGALL